MKRTIILLLVLISGLNSFAQTDLTTLIDKCSPSIFKITTYDASGNEYAVGTGFFISATGIALSNYHVFQGASKAKIKTSDNKTYLVENVIGWSKESDLLKFTVKNELSETFPFLKMNAVSPKQGEKIFIIGNPLGLEKSVADGIVSSVRADEKMGETIQITAPISHGNSGSPLMNMNGDALGIVTYYLESGQNLNFAVSVKNLNILEPINAYKFPPEDGQETVVSNNSNNSSNSNSNTTTSDIYAGSKVTFCESVDDAGYPVTVSSVFNIESGGGNVTVYVDNGSTQIQSTGLIVDIYKKGSSDKYDQFIETKNYTIKSSLVATYFDYFFATAGEYVVHVYNGEEKWINDGYITINNKSGSLDIDYNDPSSTFYYIDSKVEFCTELDNLNSCSNAGSVFNISKSGSYVYVWVGQDKALKTSGVTLDIYKKKGGDYDDFVETKNYTINPDKSAFYIEYTFYNAGDYKFKFSTDNSVWIQDGTVTIKYK